MSAAKIALGKQLFSDARLSGNGKRSCKTCHNPKLGFTDGRPKPIGIDGRPLSRNAPSLWNLAWAKSLYWDGRKPTLEAQARVPIEHPNEMAGSLQIIVARLARSSETLEAFAKVFHQTNPITPKNILAALAAYERSLVSPPTRFDRWIAGDSKALTIKEYRGFQLFTGRAGCLSCHGGWRFTDNKFHDIGLDTTDPGRSAIDHIAPNSRRFKTPGLRGLKQSAPYMHDGSKASLRDVIQHYTGDFVARPSLAANIVKDLKLSTNERAELIAFLSALSH